MKISVTSYNIEGLTLEANYCQDTSLKYYIVEKSKYLNEFLSSLNSDIICIQEYTEILEIKLENYYHVVEKSDAIFYSKEKFTYVNHTYNQHHGIWLSLDMDGLVLEIVSVRLPPNDEPVLREMVLSNIDMKAKNKILVLASDTNMKKKAKKKFWIIW